MSDQYYTIEEGAGADKAVLPTATATPMVNVVAPANLPEGYTFDAQANGKTFTVTVVSDYSLYVRCFAFSISHSLLPLCSPRVALRKESHSWSPFLLTRLEAPS